MLIHQDVKKMQISKISQALAVILSVTATSVFAEDIAKSSIEIITIAAPKLAH